MNILLLNWRDPKHPKAGGAEKLNMHIIDALLERGDSVVWYALAVNGLPDVEEYRGIKIIRFGNYLTHFLAWPFFFYLGRFGKVNFIIDSIHGIGYLSNLIAPHVRRKILICEVAQNIWNEMVPFPANVIGKYIEPLQFKVYSRCFFWTISQSTKKDLVNMGVKDDHITILPMGYDGPVKKIYVNKTKEPTALFVGRLAEMKGIKDAIEAIAEINHTSNIKWKFRIIGKGTESYENKLKSMVKQKNINSSVSFLGFVSELEKFEEMGKAWVLLVPSSREGWGMIVGEANHMGTQVLGYNSPGLKDSLAYYSSGNQKIDTTSKALENALKLLKHPVIIHGKIEPGWKNLQKIIIQEVQ